MKRVFQSEFNHLDREIGKILRETSQPRGGTIAQHELMLLLHDIAKNQQRLLALVQKTTEK